eukprot:8353602-Lingulodinium_polyedra.AAC.1
MRASVRFASRYDGCLYGMMARRGVARRGMALTQHQSSTQAASRAAPKQHQNCPQAPFKH